MENLKMLDRGRQLMEDLGYTSEELNNFASSLEISFQQFVDELTEFATKVDDAKVVDVIKTFNDTIGFEVKNTDTYRDKDNIEYAFCDDCDSLEYLDTMVTIDDKRICENCFETNYVTCIKCGKIIPVNDSVQAKDTDNFYCQECADELLYFCDDCEQYFEACGIEVHGIGNVCDDCLDALLDNGDVFQCCGCDEFFHRDYEHYDENVGESFCDDCYDDREPSVIRDYHESDGDGDYDMPHLNPNKTHCKLGVEWEITGGGETDSNALEILEALGSTDTRQLAICSHDGSVPDGFEVVSCPADYTAHVNTFHWDRACQRAKNLGYTSHNGGYCGIHVHLDREYFAINDFSEHTVENKFSVVFANNIGWLKDFSRRKNFNYCRIEKDTIHKETPEEILHGGTKNKKKIGHSTALNFANSNTIEMRIFRGTLKVNSFYAILQLMDMLASLIRYKSVASCAKINLETFKNLAVKRGYRAFLDYLTERNIVDKAYDDDDVLDEDEPYENA